MNKQDENILYIAFRLYVVLFEPFIEYRDLKG
jgi:hypothetical protein